MAKKALCIGINDYPGTGSDLSGCINDANDWKNTLEGRGFKVTILLDKDATKANMKDAIKGLIRSGKNKDLLVLTYSGHGTFIPDENGDELDAKDEALCPYDIGRNRPLTDDELHDIFAERERGVRIVFISDSCHSGTVSRMAPPLSSNEPRKIRFLPPAVFLPAAAARTANMLRAIRAMPMSFHNALLMSGCQDTEYSYDAWFGGRPNGAFTYFAHDTLKGLPAGANYRTWFKRIRAKLPSQDYPQSPNLYGSLSQRNWKVLA